MQDSERPKFEPKFEEGWKKAFDGAESTPPDRVWNSIELDLASQESATMKKKVVFYQRLAAAMLVFALSAGVYAYYASQGRTELVSVKGETRNVQRATSNEQRETSNVQRAMKGNDNSGGQAEHPVVVRGDRKSEEKLVDSMEPQLAQTAQVEEPKQIALNVEENKKQEVRGEDQKEEEKKSEEELVAALREQLEGPETIVEPRESKRQGENLWLALGGSAGNYTPNTPTATTPTISQSSFASKGPALAFAMASVPKPQPKVGSSYSVGVGIGKRFGRFVVQTGVNLNKQQINYISNYDAHTSSNTSVAAMSDYIGQNSGLTITNEYTVSSTMDIVSIPVQLGYMIIDRRLGWQINGGMSNDFFLRNVLVDKSGQRSKFTQEAGSESPYRSVNWSALASTELSYRVGRHYRVSLVPGARYSFNSILKNTKDNGRPVVLDVGFRFRYIFD